MLPSPNRIKQKEFPVLFKGGRSIHTPFFTLNYGDIPVNIPVRGPKVTIVVSKSVAKGAVDRNKIRRRIYGSLQKHKKLLKNKGFYIFLAKKEAASAPFKSIEQALTETLSKVSK